MGSFFLIGPKIKWYQKELPQYPFAKPRMMGKSLGSLQLLVFGVGEIYLYFTEMIFTEMWRKVNFSLWIIVTQEKERTKGTI